MRRHRRRFLDLLAQIQARFEALAATWDVATGPSLLAWAVARTQQLVRRCAGSAESARRLAALG